MKLVWNLLASALSRRFLLFVACDQRPDVFVSLQAMLLLLSKSAVAEMIPWKSSPFFSGQNQWKASLFRHQGQVLEWSALNKKVIYAHKDVIEIFEIATSLVIPILELSADNDKSQISLNWSCIEREQSHTQFASVKSMTLCQRFLTLLWPL